MGGSKNFFISPQNCKTESAKFHEILTSVWGESKNFFIPHPQKIVCVWVGGLKTGTGIFLLHFQNSASRVIDVGPFTVFPTTFLRFTIATIFLFRAPLVAKIGKKSNGHLHWDAVEAWCNNFDQI